MQAVDAKYASAEMQQRYTPDEIDHHISSEKLENSYAGILGKAIEPVIEPLGFDWKIGIALITSFAARERSEERRVGKECASTCRSRRSPDHEKKKTTMTYSMYTNDIT